MKTTTFDSNINDFWDNLVAPYKEVFERYFGDRGRDACRFPDMSILEKAKSYIMSKDPIKINRFLASLFENRICIMTDKILPNVTHLKKYPDTTNILHIPILVYCDKCTVDSEKAFRHLVFRTGVDCIGAIQCDHDNLIAGYNKSIEKYKWDNKCPINLIDCRNPLAIPTKLIRSDNKKISYRYRTFVFRNGEIYDEKRGRVLAYSYPQMQLKLLQKIDFEGKPYDKWTIVNGIIGYDEDNLKSSHSKPSKKIRPKFDK